MRRFSFKNIVLVLVIALAVWSILTSDKNIISYAQEGFINRDQDWMSLIETRNPPAPVPNVVMLDGTGKQVSIDAYRGDVVILNFWAIWCQPCLQEMPELDKLQETYRGQGLSVIPLSNDNANLQSAAQFYQRNNIVNLPILIDKGGAAFRQFRLRALPTSIVIDRRGNEVARIQGFIDWNNPQVRTWVQGILHQKS